MSFLIRFALTCFFVLVFGCSSPFTAAPTDAGSDAASDANDAATAPDTAADAQTEAGAFECRTPGDCGIVKAFCCATFELGAGTIPQCPMSSAATKCQAVCPTQIPLTCPNSGRLKVCRNAADCASDTQNPKCCDIFASGTVGSVCVSDVVSNYAISCK